MPSLCLSAHRQPYKTFCIKIKADLDVVSAKYLYIKLFLLLLPSTVKPSRLLPCLALHLEEMEKLVSGVKWKRFLLMGY